MASERKYALSRVAAGDYLLPSNDGRTIWRIARYMDGPSGGLEIPRDRDFWGVWKWHQSIGVGTYVDVEDWNRWEACDLGYMTRAEAINAAISHR